jgi:hypothetical protein
MSNKTYKVDDVVYLKIKAIIKKTDMNDAARPYLFRSEKGDSLGWLYKDEYSILDSETVSPTPVASAMPDSPAVISLLTEIRDLLKAGKAAEPMRMISTPQPPGVFFEMCHPSEEDQASADAFVDNMKTDIGNPKAGVIPDEQPQEYSDEQPQEYKEMLMHSYIKKDSRRYDGVWHVTKVGDIEGYESPSVELTRCEDAFVTFVKCVTLQYFKKNYKRHIE